jgi:hypothetical protein
LHDFCPNQVIQFFGLKYPLVLKIIHFCRK